MKEGHACHERASKEGELMTRNAELVHLQVRHSIPGRLRVRIDREWTGSAGLAQVKQWLDGQRQIHATEFRSSRGTVIIDYDARRAGTEDILGLLETGLSRLGGGKPASPARSERSPARSFNPMGTSLLSSLASGGIWNLIGLTGFLIFSLVRRVWFKRPLSENPGSFTGLVAGTLTLALAGRVAGQWRKGERGGLLPFLTGACGLAVFMGQSLTALEILWVLSLGEFLERLITEHSRRTIGEALRGRVTKAYLLVDGAEVEVPVSQVRVGDVVWVGSDADLPADGIVVGGEALVDESHLSGNALPQHRRMQDAVFAGTRVVEGFLYVRAEKVGSETYLARMLQLVEDSLANRADIEKRADLLASRLTRLGAVATLMTYAVSRSIERALSVALVMSCPCATVLATSTALAAAIANAARRGIIVKGGMALERLNLADTVCFDKTGTITSDVPRVAEIIPRAPWITENTILALAAGAETNSNHPMARGLVSEAARRNLTLVEVGEYQVFLGRGIAARLDSQEVLVGNRAFMAEHGISTTHFRRRHEGHSRVGRSVIYVARNGKLQGIIVLENQVRPGADLLIDRLRGSGVRNVELLSGDSGMVVAALGESLGLDGHRGDLLPEDKAAHIRDLQARGGRVLMVGDGVNDALALSDATVGVAMGAGGAEVALIAADISLMRNELLDLAYARELSQASFRVIEQNFWIAVLTDVVGGTAGFLGLLPPVLGGAVHIAHSLLIAWNSSRLLTWDRGLEAQRRSESVPEKHSDRHDPC